MRNMVINFKYILYHNKHNLITISCQSDLILNFCNQWLQKLAGLRVSTYTTTAKLPKDYKNLLPDSKTISRKIDMLFKDNDKQD